MKTSVIEVHAMLSVLGVDEVELQIAEVPGVESVTVNFAAKNATVRYDETRLDVADIKSDVRLRSHASAAPIAHPAVPATTAISADPVQPVAGPVAQAASTAAPVGGPEAPPAPAVAPEASSTAAPMPNAAAVPAGMKMPETTATAPDEAAAPTAAASSAPEESASLWQRLRSWVSPATASPEDEKSRATSAKKLGYDAAAIRTRPNGSDGQDKSFWA